MWRVTLRQGPHRPQAAAARPPASPSSLGVAFMAGTLVLTDTISRPSTTSSRRRLRGHRRRRPRRSGVRRPGSGFGDQRGRIDEALLADGAAQCRASPPPRARSAATPSSSTATARPSATPQNGPPTFGANWTDVDALNPFDARRRVSAPDAPDEVVHRRERTAKLAGVGRRRHDDRPRPRAAAAGARRRHRQVRRRRQPRRRVVRAVPDGRRRSGSSASPGKFDAIAVVADDGRQPAGARRARRGDVCRRSVEAVTGAEITKENQDADRARRCRSSAPSCWSSPSSRCSSARSSIFNTFSITVAQRTREIGAAAGARRQPPPGAACRCCSRPSSSGSSPRLLGLVGGVGVAVGLRRCSHVARLRASRQRASCSSPATVVIAMAAGIGRHVGAALVAGPPGRVGCRRSRRMQHVAGRQRRLRLASSGSSSASGILAARCRRRSLTGLFGRSDHAPARRRARRAAGVPRRRRARAHDRRSR